MVSLCVIHFIRHVHEHVLPSPPSCRMSSPHVHLAVLFSLIMTLGRPHTSWICHSLSFISLANSYLLSLHMFGEPCSLFTARGTLIKHVTLFMLSYIALGSTFPIFPLFITCVFLNIAIFIFQLWTIFTKKRRLYFSPFFKNNNVTTLWFPFQKKITQPIISHCFIFTHSHNVFFPLSRSPFSIKLSWDLLLNPLSLCVLRICPLCVTAIICIFYAVYVGN